MSRMRYHWTTAIAMDVYMQLTQHLSNDFIREGWLYKTGPQPGSKYRKRWMFLHERQLFYSAQPLVNVKKPLNIL